MQLIDIYDEASLEEGIRRTNATIRDEKIVFHSRFCAGGVCAVTYGLADAESAAEYLVLLKETKYKGRYSTIGQTASYLHEDDPLSASVFRDSILVIFGRNETGEKMSYRAEVGNFSFEHHDLDEYILDLYLGIDNELPVDIQIS